ncbi:MAG TPA: DNA recombination protein RmuC [Actinobacteria bacterium]|nr:DNA recombination protein RmuC [Actinomycetota bacterium]
METQVVAVLFLLVGLLAELIGGVLLGMALARSRGRTAPSVVELDALLAPVRENIESLRRAADGANRDRAAAESAITTQLTAVQERYAGLEEATGQLRLALAGGKTRGQWGEMQLEGLLDHAGLLEGVHYRRQGLRDSGTRPDIVVLLPGGGEVLVDAKFPFDAYWQSISETDETRRAEMLRKHAADVLARARELAGKGYSDVSTSPDFVVMFLPLESLLSVSLEADPLLLEKSFERRVVLATPTSMVALLRTIAFGYQRQLMAENAEEIRAAGAEMLSRLGTLSEHLDGMRRGLEQAVRGYNSFVGSYDRQVLVQARRLHEMGVEAPKGVAGAEPVAAEIRVSGSAVPRDA